jgi:thymidylate kinase
MGTAYLPSPLHRIGYDFFASIILASDYMFFLDVYPEEADRRIRQTRSTLEMFESLENLKRIRTKALFSFNRQVKDYEREQTDERHRKEIAETLELSF